MWSLIKDIKGNKYGSFYSIFSRDATHNFAQYFYELYKSCSYLQVKINRADGTPKLKNAVLRHFLDKESMDLFMRLDSKYLSEYFKSCDPQVISRQTEENIQKFSKQLNNNWQKNVDKCYNRICSFIWLVNFDYYSLLKNFDHNLTEHSVQSNPRFSKVKAAKIVENLKDFIVIAEKIDTKEDWETAFAILNKFNREADIQPKTWMCILENLEKVMCSTIFYMIIRHASNELEWKNTVVAKHEKIASLFLDTVVKNARKIAQDVLNTEKERIINDTISFIFDSNKTLRGAQFYVETWNEANRIKSASGFKHTVSFNYCMIFMELFFVKIKSICDVYTIYGAWTDLDDMHVLSQISHDLTVLSIQLSSYDLSLSDLGDRGAKIKHLSNTLLRSGESPDRVRLSRYVDSLNDEVAAMINRIIYNFNSLLTFFVKFENIDGSLKSEIKNASELSKMLNAAGCNISEIKEKTAAFLKLMNFLEIELENLDIPPSGGAEEI
jgi:hypothetical protein